MTKRPNACLILCALFSFAVLFISCSDSDDSTPAGNGSVTVQMEADFAASEAGFLHHAAAPKLSTCPTTTLDMESQEYDAGLDCDADGGVISYVTPQTFKIALKRLSFVKDDDSNVDVVPDSGTLAAAQVFDLSTLFSFAELDVAAGVITGVEAEVYYYEITMTLNDAETVRTLRVYLSDDDFEAEGSLGHHQGDITLIGDEGVELGWVYPGEEWIDSKLQTDPAAVVRPGSIDPETGHQRGPYGNAEMWDQQIFNQGAGSDTYVITAPIELTISAAVSALVGFSFPVQDSWFYEDFDGDGIFDPCNSTFDACADYAEWTPIFNPPNVTVQ